MTSDVRALAARVCLRVHTVITQLHVVEQQSDGGDASDKDAKRLAFLASFCRCMPAASGGAGTSEPASAVPASPRPSPRAPRSRAGTAALAWRGRRLGGAGRLAPTRPLGSAPRSHARGRHVGWPVWPPPAARSPSHSCKARARAPLFVCLKCASTLRSSCRRVTFGRRRLSFSVGISQALRSHNLSLPAFSDIQHPRAVTQHRQLQDTWRSRRPPAALQAAAPTLPRAA